MSQHKQLNNKTGITLNGAIDASQTSVTVAGTVTDVSALIDAPNNIFVYCSIESEILRITAVAGQVLTVVRATQGTSGAAHADTTAVRFYHTADNINELIDEKLNSGVLTTKGDIYVKTTTDIVRLPIGSDDQVLTADAAETPGVKWATPAAGGGGLAFTIETQSAPYFDDFICGDDATDELGILGWRSNKSGTGSLFENIAGEADHPGILRLRSPIASGGRSAIALLKNVGHIDPSGDWVWEAIVRVNMDLTNQERMVLGFGDVYSSPGDQSNGVYFEYVGGDTNWFLTANNGGTKTRRDTTFAVVNTNWVHLKMTKTGASIQANINGSDLGAAITTNIPTAVLNPVFKADSDATELQVADLDVDAVSFQITNLTRTT